MEGKAFTFRDLKEAVNNLSNEQLDKPVWASRENETLTINELAIMEEDIYYHIHEDENGGPLADLKEADGDEFDMANYKLVTPKGTPFLSVEF